MNALKRGKELFLIQNNEEDRLGQDLHSQVVALDSQPGGQNSQYVLEVLKYEHVK